MSQLVAKIAREKNWPFPLIENVEDFVDCTVYSTTFSSLSLEFAQTNVRCRFKQIFLLCCKNDFQMQLTMHSPPPHNRGQTALMNSFTFMGLQILVLHTFAHFCKPLICIFNQTSVRLSFNSCRFRLSRNRFHFQEGFFANMKEIMKIILRMFIVQHSSAPDCPGPRVRIRHFSP